MTEAELKLEYSLAELSERFPGEKIEIITLFDIAHVGWECDSQGALIRRDGRPELVIVDQVGGDDRPVREILEAKVGEYERLAAVTRNVLAQHMVLEGLREFGTEPPQPGDEMPEDLDPEFEAVEQTPEIEARHVDDMRKRGLKSVIELPESVLKRLRDLADQHPHAELDMHGGEKVDFDLERDSAYHAARELMRNRIAHLSAEIEKLEGEIVDVGVEMSNLDYRDTNAIDATIERYRRGQDSKT